MQREQRQQIQNHPRYSLYKNLLFIAAFSFFCLPAHATMSNFQMQQNLSCPGGGACTVSGFTAIPAGSFVAAIINVDGGTGAVPSAGASNAGTWVVPTLCATQVNCASALTAVNSVAVEWILSSTGTPTSIIVTSTTNINEATVVTFTFTGSSMAFDVGVGGTGCTGTCGGTPGTTPGFSAGTLSGTNDFILQYATMSGNFTGCPNSATSPATFPSGNGVCGLLNSTNNAAGTYATGASGQLSAGAVAFKEVSASTPILNLTQNQMPNFSWGVVSYSLLVGLLIGAGHGVTHVINPVCSVGSVAGNYAGKSQSLLDSVPIELRQTPSGAYEMAKIARDGDQS